MEQIFHHIEKLLDELKAKDWKATKVGENKVLVEKNDIEAVTSEKDIVLAQPTRKQITTDDNRNSSYTVGRLHPRKTKPARTSPVPGEQGHDKHQPISKSKEITAEESKLDGNEQDTAQGKKKPQSVIQPKNPNRLHFPKVSTPTPLSKPRQKFTCKDCGRIFAKIQNLNTHVEVVHEGKRHDCPRCLKPFTRRDVLKSHLQAVHSGVKFKCPDCHKEFSFVGALKYHQKAIHENIKVIRKRTLKLTNSSYGKRRKRQEEVENCKYPPIPVFAAENETRPSDSTDLVNHDSAPECNCNRCGAKFQKPRDLRTHCKTAHGDLKYACTQCDKTFTRSTYLRTHVESFHKGLRFDCAECSKQFNSAQTMRNHVRVAHEGQKYNCMECSKTFTQNASLKKHLETVHMGKRTKCPKCDKEFTEAGSMKVHLASVHDGKRFKCPKCPKEFTDPAHVRLHVKSLHQGLRFDCLKPECYKSFAHASSLKKHAKTHVDGGGHKKQESMDECDGESGETERTRSPVQLTSQDVASTAEPASLSNGYLNSDSTSETASRHAATAAAAEYINNVIYHMVSAAKPDLKDHRGRSDDKPTQKKGTTEIIPNLLTAPPGGGRKGGGDFDAQGRTRSASQEPLRRTDLGGGHNWASLRLTCLESSPGPKR